MAVDAPESSGRERALERPEDAEERLLDGVFLGRNRFLEFIGAAVFGFVGRRALAATPALASHDWYTTPCFGYPMCHCCNGRYCCNDCHGHSGTYDGSANSFFPNGTCWTGTNCWWSCYGGTQYRCCDWHEIVGSRHSACLCRGLIYYNSCPYGSD